jgi:hypothetical protein
MDGSWDGVMRWRLASVTNSTDDAPVAVGAGDAPLVALLQNASLGKSVVAVLPTMTTAKMRYGGAIQRLNPC